MSSDGNNAPNKNEPHLTGHAYDGIQEYDNPLPGWWKWLFIATIAFSVIYFYTAIVTNGQLSAVYSYNQELLDDTKREFASRVLKPDAPTLMELTHDADMLRLGKSIFQTNCYTCHGRDGQGLQCPNLTDNYYIHVKKITDFVDVITNGRKNGAMPAWGNRLTPNEIIVVAGYVASLRGTNVPGGRAAEGVIPPPWSDK
jgi:cytochrome c oxidase cbb3-type subunit 3